MNTHRTCVLVLALAALILTPLLGLGVQPARGQDARVKKLEKEVADLKKRLKELEALNLRLKDKSVRTLALYTRGGREIEALRRENEALRAARGEYEDLKQAQKDLKDAVKELKKLTGGGDSARAQVLSKDGSLRWFLAGAGVFLLGIIVGRFSKGTKRYRSSLEI